MEKKMTKREVINAMLANEVVKSNEVWVGYLTNELALLDKKSANKKPSKTQIENEGVKDLIEDVLSASDKALTVTEILASGVFEPFTSPQKISALLKQMIDAGKVVKTVEKKVSRFSVVSISNEVEEVDEVEGE